ncbi:hypothetical protein GCM10009850_040340 [Nonomuraea monospora]|uniref:Uncharacterized protein n=1 Tax=Nonomuraea monospora TaxID=568818 RepID=A0ABN3CHA9_9ACTN
MTAHDVARRLPAIPQLRDLSRSMAVLDAILSPEDFDRYHFFDTGWSPRGGAGLDAQRLR